MTMSYQEQADELRRLSRQQYRGARRDARAAADQYKAAKLYRAMATAPWTAPKHAAIYDGNAQAVLELADTLLQCSFSETGRAREYAAMARRYQGWADERAAGIAAYAAAGSAS